MDQDCATDVDDIGFTIDFESMSLVYTGGFSVRIVSMVDRFNDETDSPDEAELLLVQMPGEGGHLVIMMDDVKSEGGAFEDELFH